MLAAAAFVLLLVSMALINSSIRLAIYARRFLDQNDAAGGGHQSLYPPTLLASGPATGTIWRAVCGSALGHTLFQSTRQVYPELASVAAMDPMWLMEVVAMTVGGTSPHGQRAPPWRSADTSPSKRINCTTNEPEFLSLRQNQLPLVCGRYSRSSCLALSSWPAGGSEDPTVYNEALFSARRITWAPLLIVIGLCGGGVCDFTTPEVMNADIWSALILGIIQGSNRILAGELLGPLGAGSDHIRNDVGVRAAT